MLFQGLRNFFFKADFDFDSPDIDLYKFHPQIRAFLVFNGIFFNNTDSYWRFFWPTMSILLALVGTSFEMMFMYHGYDTKNYTFATESFCYFLILSTLPIVYTSVLLNRKNIMNLLNDMNTDFLYICSLGSKYKDRFLQGQLLIWQLCILWFLFTIIVVVMFIMSTLFALLYQSLFETQTEYTTRPLVFPVWLPADDPYRTPNYEIFMICELFLCLMVPQTFCVYIYILFHLLLHYYNLMDMIIIDFEVIFDGLDETVAELPRHDPRRVRVQTTLNNRMRRIIKWHILVFKSVNAVSSIYGPPLVYQVMFSSVAICLMAYQVADSLDHGKFHYLFTLLCTATCLQLWIPCYLGTLIRNKAFSVGDACWNCGWEEKSLGRLLCQDMLIVIMRAQQPVSIKFTGLPNLELETFSSDESDLLSITFLHNEQMMKYPSVREIPAAISTFLILSTSYSYFNLLRQYQ